MDLLGLTPDSLRLIQEVVRRELRAVQNTRQRPWYPPGDEIRSPQVRVALAPPGGIPGLTTVVNPGTGSGSGLQDLPGTASCEVYKLAAIAGEEVLLDTGEQLDVWNLGTASVPAGRFVPIWRARDGHWLAPAEDLLTPGTGTGTGGTSVTINSFDGITLNYDQSTNTLTVTVNYNSVTLTINRSTGAVTNITNVTGLTRVTTLPPGTLRQLVCGQTCEKWWCVNPFGTGTASGTASGTGTGDRYCFFGTEADLAAELERVGGTADGPFDSEQACQDGCLAGRTWWCVTPAGATGTGTGTALVRDDCSAVLGSLYPVLFGGVGAAHDGLTLYYQPATDRWENLAHGPSPIPGEGQFVACAPPTGKTGLEMWCSPSDGKFHMDYFCAGTLMASVTGEYQDLPVPIINFGYAPGPGIPDQTLLRCGSCDLGYVLINAPFGPGTGSGSTYPAQPFCFYGTENEAGDAAAAVGGTFTGPYANEGSCKAVCGGAGTGTGVGDCVVRGVSINVSGFTLFDLPSCTNHPCPDLNGAWTLNQLDPTWDAVSEGRECRFTTSATFTRCWDGATVEYWSIRVVKDGLGGISNAYLVAGGTGYSGIDFRYDLDGAFNGGAGATNTFHLAINGNGCNDGGPPSITTTNL